MSCRDQLGQSLTYTYDFLNRLTAISAPVSATYGYNGDGLRVQKVVGGATTYDAWATVFGLPQVLADGTNEYVWGAGLIATVPLAGGTRHYVKSDHLGSTTLLTDASGTTTGTKASFAFGETRTQSGATTRFDYTGAQKDVESGLVYLRSRYYDPAKGRFLSADVWEGDDEDPRTGHKYAYVINNPLSYVDPSGMSPCPPSGDITGMGQGGGVAGSGYPGSGCDNSVTGTLGGSTLPTGGSTRAWGRVRATLHGLDQINTRGMTYAQYEAAVRRGVAATQSDGASVYIGVNGANRYNVVIVGGSGIISVLVNINDKALERLAIRYGWH